MRVLRVEDAQGEGPYHGRNNLAEKFWHTDFNGLHPTVEDDPGLCGTPYNKSYHFGFVDAQQFCRWFTPAERVMLQQAGYMVRVYELPTEAVVVGEAQVLFKKMVGLVVGEFAPTEIEEAAIV